MANCYNRGMKNVYFYPQFDYKKVASPNPYIKDFQDSLDGKFHIINQKANHKGVLDFFRYIYKTDIYIFNWLEDLPIYKFGKVQTLVFLIFLVLNHGFKKKIIWVLHNKYSHFSDKNQWTDFMYRILVKYSDLIVTHSSEGILFVREHYPSEVFKVFYLNHPMRKKPEKIGKKMAVQYDFLIWGTLQPYKGVLEFLKFLNNSEEGKNVKLLIAGKCFDEAYKDQLRPYLNENITFKEDFFSLEEIKEMAHHSNFILFTHKTFSVLSSGALMDAIGMGAKIIGPDNGSFKDLSSLSFVKTYLTYEDIIDFGKFATNNPIDFEEVNSFYAENTWEKFGIKLGRRMQELFAR